MGIISSHASKYDNALQVITHHVWRTIPPRFELYPCSENPVETSISLYQLSDLYPYTNHAP